MVQISPLLPGGEMKSVGFQSVGVISVLASDELQKILKTCYYVYVNLKTNITMLGAVKGVVNICAHINY